jgi:hypothetical protein
MPFTLLEWFGHDVRNWSAEAVDHRNREWCPYIEHDCSKTFNDGNRSGGCSVILKEGIKIAICPNRLYAGNYQALSDVAKVAFGDGHRIIRPAEVAAVNHDGRYVAAFGHRFGRELQLPSRGGRGGYFVDWILARLDNNGDLRDFVAVEIQTIDTTGQYRTQVESLRDGNRNVGPSRAGLNWENVNKRILPQLIYKGRVLQRERLCTKGLFFVCPDVIYQRIVDRLGGIDPVDNLQPGSLTFHWYGIGDPDATGDRPLAFGGAFSTTVDHVAYKFVAPTNLPDAGVYEKAIRLALNPASRRRR